MIEKRLKDKNLCKIRTITSFVTLSSNKSTWLEQLRQIAQFSNSLVDDFKTKGYFVQSIRIVTNAFGEYLDTSDINSTIKDMQYLRDILKDDSFPDIRIRFAIGEAKTTKEIEMIPTLIKEFGDIANICVNVTCDKFGVANANLTLQCAKVIKELSEITPNSEGNFNFTVNYNCKAHIPYFPASYHNSEELDCFAIGLETPDLLVEALKSLKKEENHNIFMGNAYTIMNKTLQYHIDNILAITNNNKHRYKTKFIGIDSSAAPSKNCSSIVDIYKLLKVEYFGSAGTLEVSALLTKVFKSIKNTPLIGFSGLMLAPSEDTGLAKATRKKQIDIRTLLMYSTVCGIGLDTVAVEGNSSIEKIANICLDTGAMAYRLDKALTVRLFPIPNLSVEDITDFKSDDLCNMGVLSIL